MTAFARKVLGGLPAPNVAGAANNYSIAQDFTNDTDKAGGKVDLQISPALSLFGRYGWRSLSTNDQPPIPLPSGGGGNGNIYTRNKQLVLGTTYIASRALAARGPLRLVEHAGRQESAGARHAPTASASPDCRPIRASPAACRRRRSPATRGSAARRPTRSGSTRPCGTRRSTTRWLMGRQSIKAGYEFQHINVEVQDVNPLYGLDSYTGQFTKPVEHARRRTTCTTSPTSCSACARSTRSARSWSRTCEQDLHFTYVQDDIRVNDKLTLNAGLRYEYATPMWEANNLLTNFDPVTKTMISAKDGSISDRALVDPDRNNFGPRLGFAYTPMAKTVVRGGWGISYVHVNRIGSANLLGINGPQVVRAAVNQSPTAAGFVPTEAGYPAGLTDPSSVQPADRARSATSRVTSSSSPVQSWHVSVQREFGPHMLVDVAYVGNKATDLLLVGNLQPGGAEQRRRARFRWRRAGRFRPGATSPTTSTAASRATTPSR